MGNIIFQILVIKFLCAFERYKISVKILTERCLSAVMDSRGRHERYFGTHGQFLVKFQIDRTQHNYAKNGRNGLTAQIRTILAILSQFSILPDLIWRISKF